MAAGAMTGAESVLRTLSAGGVQACFANPGTSEMHLVAALDRVPEVRPVLALFEGVASGAADGYGRMAGIPAATLLHLGPGLGNAFANLHNAYKARTPIVNVVGDHAVPRPAQRAAGQRHRVDRAARLALVREHARRPLRRDRRRQGRGRRPQPRRPDRDARRPRRRRLGGGAGPAAPLPASRRPPVPEGASRPPPARCAPGARGAAARRRRHARARAARRRADRRRHRRPADRTTRSRAGWSAAPGVPRASRSPT